MGACREGYDLFTKFGWYHLIKNRKHLSWKLVFEDTFARFVCYFLEHKIHNTADSPEEMEYACKRCHKYQTSWNRTIINFWNKRCSNCVSKGMYNWCNKFHPAGYCFYYIAKVTKPRRRKA